MLGAVAPIGLRLAGTDVPALAAGLGLTMGVPATLANIRGRQTGFNNPTASGVPGALLAGASGFGSGGLLGGGLSALAYPQGREAGKKKRIENILYDQAVMLQDIIREKEAMDDFKDLDFVRNLQYMPRPINNLSGGMATQPQLGTAMGIANQIYGMQQ